MKYTITELLNEKGEPATDQFGNVVLAIVVEGESLPIGQLVYSPSIDGSKDAAYAKLKEIATAEAESRLAAANSPSLKDEIAKSLAEQMEAYKTNNGVGTK